MYSAAKPSREAARVRILLVDDRPSNLDALEAVLADLDEELVRATSGEEALRHLLRDDFAVILMDVRMPGMDGFETAALIRERDKCRHTPIVFLTAYQDDAGHLFRGYDNGAVDFLFKPVNPGILRSKVSVFVELKRKTDLLRRHGEALEDRNADLERRVAERTEELIRSNEELRQFAWVATHDLQEPLRTIGAYSQLLARRVGSEGEVGEFVGYITDAVRRMNALLTDIVAYSHAADRQPDRSLISLEGVLQATTMNLAKAMAESGARITNGPLPLVNADFIQLTQVLQNLIGNSLKYRSAEAPQIHVSAEEREDEWEISVRDNGIGIDPRYAEQIFAVFKRLHGRDYPGTGVGLAICKRIVERHGGRIRVISQPGAGADFRFTLSK